MPASPKTAAAVPEILSLELSPTVACFPIKMVEISCPYIPAAIEHSSMESAWINLIRILRYVSLLARIIFIGSC